MLVTSGAQHATGRGIPALPKELGQHMIGLSSDKDSGRLRLSGAPLQHTRIKRNWSKKKEPITWRKETKQQSFPRAADLSGVGRTPLPPEQWYAQGHHAALPVIRRLRRTDRPPLQAVLHGSGEGGGRGGCWRGVRRGRSTALGGTQHICLVQHHRCQVAGTVHCCPLPGHSGHLCIAVCVMF